MRNDFRAFLHKTFATLSPGQTYVSTWHVEAIAWRLESVRRGFNMPPRSLKSIVASVAFPAFVLGHDPSRRIICVSYSADLAKKHANDFRAVLESPWYRSAFPSTRIGPFKNSETEIELTARGFRLATSVGGTLTGRGGACPSARCHQGQTCAILTYKASRSGEAAHARPGLFRFSWRRKSAG